MNGTRSIWLVLVLLAVLLTGCGGRSGLVGRWEKAPVPTPTPGGSMLGGVFGAFADAMYPTTLEFFSDGTYSGMAGGLLGGGDYEVIDGNRVKLQTMTGLSVYEFLVSDNSLTLRDENGYEVAYQRVP